MKTQVEKSHDAGIRLWEIAEEYKGYRAELTPKMAFKMAILANPNLAESYLGRPVRHDRVNDVIKLLYSAVPLTENDV